LTLPGASRPAQEEGNVKAVREPARRIPITDEVDVLVIGGGTAGPAAAIAAARHASRTLLVERAGFPGGCFVGGATGFHGFWNVYHREPGAPKVKIVEGIPQEIVDRSLAAGAGVGHIEFQRSLDFNSVYTGLEPEATRLLLCDMIAESGARMLLHTTAVAAWTDGDRHIVVTESKAGRSAIVARQVIDCTGDGDVAAWLGAPYENFTGDQCWGTSLTFRMANVHFEQLLPWMDEHGTVTQIVVGRKIGGTEDEIVRLAMRWPENLVEEAKRRGVRSGMICNSLRRHEATYCNCTGVKLADNIDPADLTRAEADLRRQGQAHAAFMRQFFPGCEDAFVSAHSPTLGVRRSRIFRTEHEVTREEMLAGRHHDDTIGFVSFVDLGDYWITNAGCFGIPYRAIVPQRVDNLLLAGRMVGRDEVVFQALRNTVPSVEEGQAAGTAAAICARNGVTPRRLDPGMLRDVLAADGARVDCPELKQD